MRRESSSSRFVVRPPLFLPSFWKGGAGIRATVSPRGLNAVQRFSDDWIVQAVNGD
jgi:hypothetical protein